MKKFITCAACVILALPAFALDKKQPVDTIFSRNKKEPFPFDEFAISMNKTTVADDNTKNRFGFGAGVYHVFFKNKEANLISGVEFTHTSQFKYEGTYFNKFSYSRDVTYLVNTLSIPFSVRFNMGEKFKFFIETGVYFDLTVGSNMSGRIYGAREVMDSTGQYHSIAFDNKLNEGADLRFFNGGASGGIGFSIPLSGKLDLILKSDYRYGALDMSEYGVFFNRYFRVTVGLNWN